ncbi:MAG: acetate/propionate family kinase [Isosphaeraceae bacterium]|nr:acetate/propionate family kinase [Isosphaeraceae bacterium]
MSEADEHSTTDRPSGATLPHSCIMTVNGGSSSLKFAVFARDGSPGRLFSGRVERLGHDDARWIVNGPDGQRREDQPVAAPDQGAAARLVIESVQRSLGPAAIAAVGHRVVHGGTRFVGPEVVSAELLDDLRRLTPFDPDHLPGEVALIEAFERAFTGIPQVACFDTAFHSDLPRLAQIVPIPRRFEVAGIRRYGFHGLSYAYLMEELARVAGPAAAKGRVILAHLGSGASLAAVHGGRCVDTTMGLTPASGLVMGTRSGDVDPGLPYVLATVAGVATERFHEMVNHESGLLGVSETSGDLRDLLARRADDPRAAEAVDLFCYQAKKGIGAFAAALGGLDTLVFAGGIGENSPEARSGICAGLEFLGIRLDHERNETGAPTISPDSSAATVRVIRTDEEAMIARETIRLLARRD